MKFDTIIIGGGLSGLTCAIALAESGKKCAVASSGQSSLNFASGSFDLLGRVDEFDVESPEASIGKVVDKCHPYSLIGTQNVLSLAREAQELLGRAGIKTVGSARRNHFRITPMGLLKPTWLTLDDMATVPLGTELPWKRVSIQNITGFLDFHTAFLAANIEKQGASCAVRHFSLPELDKLRANPTEMRSTNIAKKFEDLDLTRRAARQIVANLAGESVVLLPAVWGLYSDEPAQLLRREIKKAVGVTAVMVPALPPSVPGIRMQTLLRKRLQSLGGTFLPGDSVTRATLSGNRVVSVNTANLEDTPLEADNFVLATGSFFTHGLQADRDRIFEPVFGLDVLAPADRGKWCKPGVFDAQPYMSLGLKTDSSLRGYIGSEPLANLRVAGAGLGAFNPIKEASGAGVSIISALHAAKCITFSDQSHE